MRIETQCLRLHIFWDLVLIQDPGMRLYSHHQSFLFYYISGFWALSFLFPCPSKPTHPLLPLGICIISLMSQGFLPKTERSISFKAASAFCPERIPKARKKQQKAWLTVPAWKEKAMEKYSKWININYLVTDTSEVTWENSAQQGWLHAEWQPVTQWELEKEKEGGCWALWGKLSW